MTDTSMLGPPGGPAFPAHAPARPGPLGPALVTAVLIIVGSLVVGLVGGAIWAAAAPRVLYQVYTLNPPTAYATNPETSAFIGADGWYCVIALAGGALIGLLGYLFGVRRHGPVAMASIVIGSVGAAFTAAWLGNQLSGASDFDRQLATSKPGAFLHAPISLGSHGALAFWPVAAAAVAGGIELLGFMKARRQQAYGQTPMPGIDTLGVRPYSARSYPGRDGALGAGHPKPAHGQDVPGGPGGPDPHDGG